MKITMNECKASNSYLLNLDKYSESANCFCKPFVCRYEYCEHKYVLIVNVFSFPLSSIFLQKSWINIYHAVEQNSLVIKVVHLSLLVYPFNYEPIYWTFALFRWCHKMLVSGYIKSTLLSTVINKDMNR